uniref:Drosophila ultrabithorax (Ubx) protein n=1 Tax=Drosophila melanogaster TaxID=7227 RepID=A2NUB8_DROME|nr:hypothetical protein (Ultrabithorax promoter region) - fruit fly (Drosophila melanogaster) [Drosophila melanogaster]CAA29008.1 unnamed protein product [Drosophila melanogaster]prf//1308139A Ultrabithorax protein [Drosophila melanogaster]
MATDWITGARFVLLSTLSAALLLLLALSALPLAHASARECRAEKSLSTRLASRFEEIRQQTHSRPFGQH